MAMLCPFGSKEQRTRNKEQRVRIKEQRVRNKEQRAKQKAYLQVALLLCLFSGPLMAQDTRPLKVGDKLPETFWQQEHTVYANGKTTQQTLAPYKGKLLILQFWATWCGTCIGKLPLLDSLSQLNMKVQLVSSKKAREGFAQIDRFFTQSPMGQKHPQPSIIDDELLGQLFPFRQVPHYVWIDYQGRVVAITNYLFTGVPLVQKVLAVQQRALAKREGQ